MNCTTPPPRDLFWSAERACESSSSSLSGHDNDESGESQPQPSRFEAIISTHPPILESLLSQLPTTSIFDLYHTSGYLRRFLASYPLAWKTLSFRLPQPAPLVLGSPAAVDTPGGRDRESKKYSLDALLIQVVVPFGTRLKNLDLCNTAVSGVSLVSRVLQPRISTIEHLSVRGCKHVSIKYHIVPFLEPYTHRHPWAARDDLALKSLYTYRCRHHRRRPYLPSSLIRRDSDSEPTHQLIEICHELGIWTDTAWCPTPGGRCLRRKEYHGNRGPPGSTEVWVPFDRLWRSGNRIGSNNSSRERRPSDGRLWEEWESGHDGEALGPQDGPFRGEGKDVPAHLRQSHRAFMESIKCDSCGDDISERCEACSIRMHCMGCRKTLCASCAYDRPLPRKRAKTRHFATLAFGSSNAMGFSSNTSSASMASGFGSTAGESPKKPKFWWAPGATRSPNLMHEATNDDSDSDSDDTIANNAIAGVTFNTPPRLQMRWCCLEPIFSAGGGIAFLGPGLGGRGADKVRATPLPRIKKYEDPDFTAVLRPDAMRDMKNQSLYDHVLGEDVDVLPYLKQDSLEIQATTCPRSLCQNCYRTFRWKVPCRACKKPLCKEHDFRGLKVRKCGYRNLSVEREYARNHPEPTDLQIPAFNPLKLKPASSTSNLLASASSSAMASTQDQEGDDTLSASIAGLDMSTLVTSSSDLDLTSRPSRPRALSVSDLRRRHLKTWQNALNLPPRSSVPLPGHPRHPVQWQGCGAYFCQRDRPVGDSRQRCIANVKECTDCGVYVCYDCTQANPTCMCAYCAANFHCPQCATKSSVIAQCRQEEEAQARLRKEQEAAELRKLEEEGLKQSDMLVESVQEFFTALFGVDWEQEAEAVEPVDVTALVEEEQDRDPEEDENDDLNADNASNANGDGDGEPASSPNQNPMSDSEAGDEESEGSMPALDIVAGAAPTPVGTPEGLENEEDGGVVLP